MAADIAVIAVSVVLVVALVLGRPLVVRFGRLEAKLDGIDKAVNSRPAGEPALYDQVVACKTALGEIDGKLTDHLAWHQQEAQR